MQSSHESTGPALAYRLKRLGLSPEQFAARADLSATAVRRHEQGLILNPRRSTLRKLSDALAEFEAQMNDNRETPSW
jgi:predicted transcriptional regulator